MSFFNFFGNKPTLFAYPYGLKANSAKALAEMEMIISMGGDDDINESMAYLFCWIILGRPPASRVCTLLKKEIKTTKTKINGIEAQAFDMWLTCRSLTQALKGRKGVDVNRVFDHGHLYVLQHLVEFGANKENIMRLQKLLHDRYEEYGAAFSDLAGEDDRGKFNFGKAFMKHVLDSDMTEPGIWIGVSAFATSFMTETVSTIDKYMSI